MKCLPATFTLSTFHTGEARERYSDWDIRDYSDFYVSPGLIDCNVLNNPEWESRTQTSKTALAGGVTFYLEEDSLYSQRDDPSPCYCDVGRIRRVTSLSSFIQERSAFAYKVYLYPPSQTVPGFSETLEDLFDKVVSTSLPLFVDSSLPPPRMLYMASPYRHSSLEERVTAVYVDESGFGAGAYQEEEVLSSESGSEEVYSKPGRCHSSIEEQAFERTPMKSPGLSWDRISREKRPRGHTEDLEELLMPDSILPTIISDLNKRIDSLHESQYDLIMSEQRTYEQAWKYIYTESFEPPATKSTSQTAICTKGKQQSPQSSSLTKKSRLRPKPLSLEKKMDDSDMKERDYVFHLGSCPDHWEIAGIEKVLRALRRAPCRVHFCNVSSAAGVNKVRIFKESKYADSVTVETTAHYLFFTKDDISLGDTRLKSFPPIRNKSNCNLLWELLKVKAIDVISSHHSSIPRELKFLDSGNFKKALSGVKGIGTALMAVWTKVRVPTATGPSVWERYIVRMAKWLSFNPAQLIGIGHKRGSIEQGKFADLLMWSPYEDSKVDDEASPYSGKRLFGRVKAVFVRGAVAFEDGVCHPVGRLMTRSEFY